MSEIKDGGPAFPVQDASTWQAHGMTLRDYFAAKAMQALVSDATTLEAIKKTADDLKLGESECAAKAAYEYADAMLKARQE